MSRTISRESASKFILKYPAITINELLRSDENRNVLIIALKDWNKKHPQEQVII